MANRNTNMFLFPNKLTHSDQTIIRFFNEIFNNKQQVNIVIYTDFSRAINVNYNMNTH